MLAAPLSPAPFQRALRAAMAAVLLATSLSPTWAGIERAPGGAGDAKPLAALHLVSSAVEKAVRSADLKAPSVIFSDPKIAAFLERSRQVRSENPAAQGAGSAARKLEPSQALSSLNLALSRYEARDIQEMSAQDLNSVAKQLWDHSRQSGGSSSGADGGSEGSGGSSGSGALKPRAARAAKTAREVPGPESAAPQTPASEKPYVRNAIASSRFGEGDRQKLLKTAYQLKERIDKLLVGQGHASKVLQDRLAQYLEELGTRTKDPIAEHMIGLPGIGKSDMVDQLQALGIPMLRIDAQKYAKKDAAAADEIRGQLEPYLSQHKGAPFILAIEELDKIPENGGKAALLGVEQTNSMIGALNEILTEGKLPGRWAGEAPLDLSNVFVVTTMNFAPDEIERFSLEALKKKKSYYDFTTEDFAKFDRWIRKEPSATYKILSRLFRSNTVSRLAPNTIILKPFAEGDFKSIARLTAERVILRDTSGANAGKRIAVQASERFIDFLAKATAYAPSGARQTIYRADALTEQLIAYGSRAVAAGDRSLDRPRKILIDFDPAESSAAVTVIPRVLRAGKWTEGKSFKFRVRYDAGLGAWMQPKGLAFEPPPKLAMKGARAKRLTNADILEARFPKTQNAARGLADKIDQKLIGQRDFTRLVEKEMNAYLGRSRPALKEPATLTFAGFPGIGKSKLAELAGEYLGLPVIRVNMQQFSSSDSKAVENFMETLGKGINSAKGKTGTWKGKYIVLLEEIDKIHEIDPKEGKLVNRPVMAAVKDLLNDGQASVSTENRTRAIDIRDGFLFVTMNFNVDRFGFKADPRQTSIKDVRRAWKRLSTHLTDMKHVMGSMFLPDTVDRLMPRLHIMAPLLEADYRKIIELQAVDAVRERLENDKGENNGLITVKLSPAYKQYLFAETVVPSEGGRHTSVVSRIKISADIESAIKNLKRSSRYATKPITITLDYKPGSSTVTAKVASPALPQEKPVEVFREKAPLFFPPIRVRGRMEESRILTGAHEFGHAYTGVRLGLRIDYATVISPEHGIGGYVKWGQETSESAKNLMSHVYASLGSRAMERIFLSPDARQQSSVLDITSGPSQDIKSASYLLYSMLHELGFDPTGGTLDRLGVIHGEKYADFQSLPHPIVERLGTIMRKMEDQVVDDLLAANPREWYVRKITDFARAGGVEEKELYEILGYPHPGEGGDSIAETSLLHRDFAGAIKPASAKLKAVRGFKQGLTRTTAAENLEAYRKRFVEILKETAGRPKP